MDDWDGWDDYLDDWDEGDDYGEEDWFEEMEWDEGEEYLDYGDEEEEYFDDFEEPSSDPVPVPEPKVPDQVLPKPVP